MKGKKYLYGRGPGGYISRPGSYRDIEKEAYGAEGYSNNQEGGLKESKVKEVK